MVTSKQANADITSVKKGGREREGGGGRMNILKSVRNKTVMRDKELRVGQVEGWVRCRRRKLNQKREQEAEAKAQTSP